MSMFADEGWGCGPSSNENKKWVLLYLFMFMIWDAIVSQIIHRDFIFYISILLDLNTSALI